MELPVFTQQIRTKLKVCEPRGIYGDFKNVLNADQESFWLYSLTAKNEIIQRDLIALGNNDQCAVYVGLLMRRALLRNASCIVIVHNHPSGEVTPSTADINITKRIKSACALLDIQFLDHIIVSTDGYFSFAEKTILRDL